jgi:hypothetical protein
MEVNEIFRLGARAEMLLRLRKQLSSQSLSNETLLKRYSQELSSIRAQLDALANSIKSKRRAHDS